MSVFHTAAEFRIALDKIAVEMTDELALDITKKVAIDLLARLVLKSPVLTGRYRGNWTVSVDDRDYSVSAEFDPAGGATIASGQAVIGKIRTLPEAVYLQNNVPYASRIESGWSKQAPAGVVAVSLAELEASGIRRLI